VCVCVCVRTCACVYVYVCTCACVCILPDCTRNGNIVARVCMVKTTMGRRDFGMLFVELLLDLDAGPASTI